MLGLFLAGHAGRCRVPEHNTGLSVLVLGPARRDHSASQAMYLLFEVKGLIAGVCDKGVVTLICVLQDVLI